MSEKSFGEQSYESFAPRYAAAVETKPINALLVAPAVLTLMPPLNGLRVLDAGCGSGWFSERFLIDGARVTAFDVTPGFVDIARERLQGRAEVLRHDLHEPLTFAADAAFDVIFSNLVLDYIRDWTPVMREFARVLAPGGVLVFTCGHPLGDWLWFQRAGARVTIEGELNYFATQVFEAEWSGFGEPRPRVKSYRRPFEAILMPIVQSGLLIDELDEIQPAEAFRDADPVEYERMSRQPSFLAVRASRPR